MIFWCALCYLVGIAATESNGKFNLQFTMENSKKIYKYPSSRNIFKISRFFNSGIYNSSESANNMIKIGRGKNLIFSVNCYQTEFEIAMNIFEMRKLDMEIPIKNALTIMELVDCLEIQDESRKINFYKALASLVNYPHYDFDSDVIGILPHINALKSSKILMIFIYQSLLNDININLMFDPLKHSIALNSLNGFVEFKNQQNFVLKKPETEYYMLHRDIRLRKMCFFIDIFGITELDLSSSDILPNHLELFACLLNHPNIISLNLSDCKASDEIAYLLNSASLSGLTHLKMSKSDISEIEYKIIAGISSLKCLDISDSNIYGDINEFIYLLKGIRLTVLDLSNIDLGVEAIKELSNLKTLKVLDLKNTGIGGIVNVPVSPLINLEIEELTISENSLSLEDLEAIGKMKSLTRLIAENCLISKGLNRLKDLKLNKLIISCNNLPKYDLDTIGRMKNLRILEMKDCRLGGFCDFIRYLPKLLRLSVSNNQLTKEDIKSIVYLKGCLNYLYLQNCDIYGNLKYFSNLNLLDLVLSNCSLSENDMEVLGSIRTLENLYIPECNIPKNSFGNLKNLNLRFLSIKNIENLGPNDIQILKGMSNLNKIRIGPEYIENVLPYLDRLKITSLNLDKTMATEHVFHIINSNRKLKTLSLRITDENQMKNFYSRVLMKLKIQAPSFSATSYEKIEKMSFLFSLELISTERTDFCSKLSFLLRKLRITDLRLCNFNLKEEDFEAIGQMKILKKLSLINCHDPINFYHLRNLRLEALEITGISEKNNNLDGLLHLHTLREVKIRGDGLGKVSIRNFDFQGISNVTRLEIENVSLSNGDLETINRMRRLKQLSLCECDVTGRLDCLYDLRLRELKVKGEVDISDARFIGGLKTLRVMDVDFSNIDFNWYKYLISGLHLTELAVQQSLLIKYYSEISSLEDLLVLTIYKELPNEGELLK